MKQLGSNYLDKVCSILIEPNQTKINDVKDSKDLNAPIYNLSGQRLQEMQKGVNIVNGKKILVK